MRRNGWHTQWRGETLVLARRWPARFDLRAEIWLPSVGRPARLAHQIRQDIWRGLRELRGFSPCVEVTQTSEGVRVLAGGETVSIPPARARDQLDAVLSNPANRARWTRCAA